MFDDYGKRDLNLWICFVELPKQLQQRSDSSMILGAEKN